jgi:hypothetical protein
MKIGTKSVLFGAHQFLIHPWFVALAWWKLYGFPWDPRLWVAFFVHDLGYIGKPNMDGPEGEEHPYYGACIMSRLFDNWWDPNQNWTPIENSDAWIGPWGQFVFFHSRYMAKRYGVRPSRLCVADKLAIALTPAWLYLPLARATGELDEYMERAKVRSARNEQVNKYENMNLNSGDPYKWYAGVQAYLQRWAEHHKDGCEDTWTPKID